MRTRRKRRRKKGRRGEGRKRAGRRRENNTWWKERDAGGGGRESLGAPPGSGTLSLADCKIEDEDKVKVKDYLRLPLSPRAGEGECSPD